MKVPVKDLTPGTVLTNGHTVKRIRKSGDAIAVDTFDLLGEEHETLEAPTALYEVEAVDITPSWEALVPIFVGVLQNPEAPITAHREAIANLTQMGALADRYVGAVKRGSGDIVGLTPVLGDPDQKES
jgi:hypothetical protein